MIRKGLTFYIFSSVLFELFFPARIYYLHNVCVIYICVYVFMCECVFVPVSGVRAVYKRKGFCGL